MGLKITRESRDSMRYQPGRNIRTADYKKLYKMWEYIKIFYIENWSESLMIEKDKKLDWEEDEMKLYNTNWWSENLLTTSLLKEPELIYSASIQTFVECSSLLRLSRVHGQIKLKLPLLRVWSVAVRDEHFLSARSSFDVQTFSTRMNDCFLVLKFIHAKINFNYTIYSNFTCCFDFQKQHI